MNGILIPYIKKDIDTISIPHELYRKVYLIFCYLTMWSLIFSFSTINLTKRGHKFPAFIWRSAFSLTITSSICGTYVAYSKTDKFIEKYKIPILLIYFSDFITHIVPFFVVLSYRKFMINNSLPKTNNLFLKMLGFNTLFNSSYFILFGDYLYPINTFNLVGGYSFVNLLLTTYYSLI
tara:strand:+ start:33 stop:566 length:534 start_codon:yes stop_codon:yes gene_type:complete